MPDTSKDDDTGQSGAQRMVLLRVNEGYWLSEGKEFLNQMLMGTGPFPTPVLCYTFQDAFELRAYLGPDRVVTDFWGINPDIVERLRRDGHLDETPPPEE